LTIPAPHTVLRTPPAAHPPRPLPRPSFNNGDATTGRATTTLNNATTFGDTQVVFYEAGGRQLYIMDQTAATPVIGALIQ